MKSGRMLAAAIVLGTLPLSPAHATLDKTIRDWSVTCTNGLTCVMSFADWDSKDIRQLQFRRTDAPNADVSMIVTAPPDFADKGDSTGAYTFSIDGKPVLSLPVSSLARDPVTEDLVFSDQKAIAGLLEAMKAGTTMDLTYKGGLGAFKLAVKLSGVKGSLVYVDEAQDRLKRTDALEVKGDKAPPEKAMAADILRIEDLPAVIRDDFTADGGACSGLDADIGNFGGFTMTAEDVQWIVVPCGIGGAYNQPYALYANYDVVTERIAFPDIRNGKPSAMTTAYNIDFDPKTKTFTAFFRGRGIGDCGQWSKWAIDVGGSAALLLLEERDKGDCDENNMGGPQNFPLVWPMK